MHRVSEAEEEDESSEEIYDLSVEEVSVEVLRRNRRTIVTKNHSFFKNYKRTNILNKTRSPHSSEQQLITAKVTGQRITFKEDNCKK